MEKLSKIFFSLPPPKAWKNAEDLGLREERKHISRQAVKQHFFFFFIFFFSSSSHVGQGWVAGHKGAVLG